MKKELEEDRCVHTEHCCVLHGCKYGNKDCPVELGFKRQSYLCEYCDFGWENTEKENISLWKKIKKARKRAKTKSR